MAKPLHQCNHAGCRVLIPYDEPYCDKHKQLKPNKVEAHARYVEKREIGGKYWRFYRSKAWKRASMAWRLNHPICERCKAQGKIVAVDVVDHRIPLRIDWSRRLDDTNFSSLCHACHVIKTQEDKQKYHLPALKDDKQ